VVAWYINTDRRQALLRLATAMHVRLACRGQTLQVIPVHDPYIYAMWLPVSGRNFVHSLRAEACIVLWRLLQVHAVLTTHAAMNTLLGTCPVLRV
jgi:hypothetical protein